MCNVFYYTRNRFLIEFSSCSTWEIRLYLRIVLLHIFDVPKLIFVTTYLLKSLPILRAKTENPFPFLFPSCFFHRTPSFNRDEVIHEYLAREEVTEFLEPRTIHARAAARGPI